MKKTFLAIALLAFTTCGAFAQQQTQKTSQTTAVTPKDQNASLEFMNTSHDFGSLKEGDPAIAEFSFKNTGKEPIIIQNVRPSCGCTTPYWSKDPIAPGKTGVVKASYGTQGRPGAFNKSITVTSNAGTQVLYIKGSVSKAPDASAPQSTSMMKK